MPGLLVVSPVWVECRFGPSPVVADLPELVGEVSNPLVQRVIDLARECGVRFYVIPRDTRPGYDTRDELEATPCPIEDGDPMTHIPLYCRMADTEEGEPGAVLLVDTLTREEWTAGWSPYHGAVVLLHEVAHAVVGEDEELTVPWEQAACVELFGVGKRGQEMFDNLLQYEDGAGVSAGIRWAEVRLQETGIVTEDGVARRAYKGLTWSGRIRG